MHLIIPGGPALALYNSSTHENLDAPFPSVCLIHYGHRPVNPFDGSPAAALCVADPLILYEIGQSFA